MNSNIFKLSFLSLSLFFLFTLNSNAQITVDNLADGPGNAGDCEIDAPPVGVNCSLRDAIEAANANAGADEIIFDGGLALPGTITLNDGQMTITDDLTITGPGANILTIDAQDNSRIFLVDDGSDMNVIVVEIMGLRFFDGSIPGFSTINSSGGAISNFENLNIESCDFESNEAGANGGAIFNNSGNTLLNIRNSNFDFNTANLEANGGSNGGGAIFNLSGLPDGTINEIINSTFTSNSTMMNGPNTPDGGAIVNLGTINNIIGCIFENNRSIPGFGGAIDMGGDATIQNIVDTQFINNTASEAGGAINMGGEGIQLIDNCVFVGNNTFLSNGFASGGAINVFSSTITEIRSSTFNDNLSVAGGAIAVDGFDFGTPFPGEITNINNSTFTNNTADAGSVTEFLTGTRGTGGAIFFDLVSSASNIINSTFEGNEAIGATNISSGGAIYSSKITNPNPVNISFSTIVNNNTTDDGGGLGSTSSSMDVFNIRNSIIAFNTASDVGDNCQFDYADESMDETNNYSNDASCGFDFDSAAGIMLGSLADNGGPTQTIALNGGPPEDGASTDCDPLNNFGSATGIAIPTDQRLFTRPVGAACDAGAFEIGAAPETVTINLTKVTNPEGGLGFDFTSTNFDTLIGCMIDDTFTMDHNDTFTCDIPVGDYTIDEDIPGDQELQIVCNEGPANLIANNLTGETTFTVINPTDDINCVYINSSPDFLSLVTPEPEGANCEFGGVRVDTGFDDNFDGILDPGEIDDTQFFCNTQLPPVIIPGPPQGDDDDDDDNNDDLESLVDLNVEPAGVNCQFGGVRVDTGIDDNGDGILQANEIDDTNFICNDDPDNNNSNNSNNSSDSRCSIAGSGDTNGLSLFSALLPFLMVPFVVFRRRKRHQK